MKLRIIVKIGRKQGLLGWDGEQLVVGVDAPPIDGAANKKLIEVLSECFGISKSNIHIIKGQKTRYKTLEVKIDADLFNDLVGHLQRQETLF